MTKNKWIEEYSNVLKKHHKKNIRKLAIILFKKANSIRGSMKTRSKKYNTKFDICIDDLRKLILESYGKSCKYFPNRKLLHDNIVFDHKIPLSKGGDSTIDNIQIISKFANNMKGNLSEDNFIIFLDWLNNTNEELRNYISVRLTYGNRW